MRELEEITNPYNFGLQLGIDSKVLDRIDRDHRNDVERQRSEIIKYWYRNTKKSERTWGSLADAIGRLGGHSNLETELRQLGTTPTGPRIPTTPGAASSPTEFADDLSPTELVSWLSQQFQAKGLTLDPSLGQTLIGNTNVHTCASVYMTLSVCVCAWITVIECVWQLRIRRVLQWVLRYVKAWVRRGRSVITCAPYIPTRLVT